MPNGHGGAAERQKYRGGGRLNHDVRAYALNALGRLLHHAAGEPDDNDDQGHFHGHRKHTHNCPRIKPVNDIPEDHLADHG